MKKGLVLEGGGMRGLFTAGVTDLLMENDITFDGLVGVSAGAAFGSNIKSGQIGRALRYNTKYCSNPEYCSFRSLIKTGDLFGRDFCYRRLPEELDIFDKEAFDKNPMEFYAVCTDVMTGKPVYKKIEKADQACYEWICASASMPLVSNVTKIDGLLLLDGGISDSIPLEFFESIGYDRNVVITTQPAEYVKKKSSMLPLMKLMLKKYPGVIKAMEIRHEMYNNQKKYISEKEKSGEIILINPPEILPLSRVEKDPQKLLAVYNIGRAEAQKNLDKIKEFFKRLND